ncbi:MAG: SpoIID/LytB domain-containing protein [Planctomycetota bacterium]
MSSTIQLTAGPRKTALRTVSWTNHLRISSGRGAILVLLLLALNSCKSRQFTRPTVQMEVEQRFWIRVLLLDDARSCTLKTGSPFSVTKDRIIPQTQIAKVRFTKVDAPFIIRVADGNITIAGRAFTSGEVVIFTEDPYIFNLNGNDYRGNLKLITNPDGSSFDAINLVPPEPYLAGVVGAEMPDYWEADALKAQAIAARTYCFYIKRRFGANRNWDVKQTEANQVYRGLREETTQIWNAVNQTKGQVLMCAQADGTEDIFPSYYSSTCGGHTENSRNVFGDSFGPLGGVRCPYCQDVAQPKDFFWPMIRFDRANVTAKLLQKYPALKQLGEITNISPAGESDYGEFSRVTKVKLTGSTGKSDFLRAEDFRLTIDSTGLKLKSSICKIVKWDNDWAFLSGRGWGHGVGMCQYGAEGMAREGKNVEQILSYYYPGSKILTLGY